MPVFRGKIPKIVWGVGMANTLSIGYPLDEAITYSEPRDGSSFVQGASGIEDSWIQGFDRILEGTIRWIPPDATASPLATGWNDASIGFEEWLDDARKKNIFQFHFDLLQPGLYLNMYLVEPMNGGVEMEDDFTRRVKLKMRNSATSGPLGGF